MLIERIISGMNHSHTNVKGIINWRGQDTQGHALDTKVNKIIVEDSYYEKEYWFKIE